MQQEPTIPQTPIQHTHDLPNMPPADSPLEPMPRKPVNEGARSVMSTLAIVILAPLIALLLINYVFQSYEVDGPSMQQTLHNADRLIVWKLPRTVARITNNDYIPHKGDIIVFAKNESINERTGEKKQLIKRVIGLPGDRVVVDEGMVTVYNDANPRGYNPDAGTVYEKDLRGTTGNVDITVNEGEVFVLGDNRSNSSDSREFGSIKAEDIVGKLEFRIFPFNQFKQY